ncbi:Protein of unknown function [Bacillus mycoides]|nr:Protein of unknown function [Bacillus mycoides]
MEDQTG